MTYANETFERTVSAWLHADAEHRVPDHLEAVLRLTSVQRQRPAWSSLERWLPMDTTFHPRLYPPRRLGQIVLVGALVIALLGLAILYAGSRQQRLPAPFGPAANGVILYGGNDGDIYAAEPDGSNPRRLVGGPERDLAPTASNDGTRFVFLRMVSDDRFDVFAANADGRDLRKLTEVALSAVRWLDWSPDGRHLVVLHSTDGTPGLSIVKTDGTGSVLASLGSIVPEVPQWRPTDGRSIVFRGIAPDGVSLYSIAPDGTGLQPIAEVKPDDTYYLGLRLSPDGSRATYWHDLVAPTSEGHKSEVKVLDLQTKVETRIGYDATSRHELEPKFSPDGEDVLLVRFPKDADARFVIAAADGSDGPGRQIGPPQGWDENPIFEFSPDGKKILVTFGLNRRLQVIDIASGAIETGDYADFPTWVRMAP